MLVEFKVKNFLSIQEDQTLSCVASNDKEHLEHVYQSNLNVIPNLLNTIAIYGANASGKSNILKAFNTMRFIIFKGTCDYENLIPFKLGDSEKQPSEFEITFVMDNKRYQYGFSATKERVYEEWLLVYESARAQTWFQRSYNDKQDKYSWKYSTKLVGKVKIWEESTRIDTLFLTTARNLNSSMLSPIYNFIILNIMIGENAKVRWCDEMDVTAMLYNDGEKNKKLINNFLKSADLDINELIINFKEEDNKNIVKAKHLKQNNIDFETFRLEDESEGTKQLFKLIGPILEIAKRGGVMLIDELEAHLHPKITKLLIDIFNNKDINRNKAQLIFTTHETTLLNQDFFRKDQIYFCEKTNKATQFYSLNEFKLRKDSQNWEKMYLLGKFGALPKVKAIEL